MAWLDEFDEAQEHFDNKRWEEELKKKQTYDPSEDYIFTKFWAPIEGDE